MANHQRLTGYSGSLYGEPHYQGIEYDWEVPDDMVVGSPGGVSTIHHHYTKGFYGRGETSSDVYAGQQQRYNAGEFGNLYQSGQTASQAMGYYPAAPDYQYWQNEEPQQYSQSQQPNTMPLPGSPVLHGFPAQATFKKGSKEGFEIDPSFELIDSDVSPIESMPDSSEMSIQTKMNIWALLGIAFVIFIVFCLWAKAGDRFLIQYLHAGKRPSWQRLVLYAMGGTVILMIILHFAGVRLSS